ncbi:hypothetical protein ABTK13_22995, partial [Acinetobacter baumannii]|jgi:hypothetical protein
MGALGSLDLQKRWSIRTFQGGIRQRLCSLTSPPTAIRVAPFIAENASVPELTGNCPVTAVSVFFRSRSCKTEREL